MIEQSKAEKSDNRLSSSRDSPWYWKRWRIGRSLAAATRRRRRIKYKRRRDSAAGRRRERKHKDRSSWQGEAESAGRYAGFEMARGVERLRLLLRLLLLLTWPREQDLALPVANAEPCAVEQTKGKGSGGRDGGVLGSGGLCYNNKSACHSAVGPSDRALQRPADWGVTGHLAG
jgi:hypothetical protein